jgi:branched-chain amino acid transport system ATP-binding protein/branched-chain amino acid transport system permease protein
MRRPVPKNRLRPALLGSILISLALTGGMMGVRTFGSPLASRTYVVFLINVMLVVSFQLFIGNSGIVSFGHIAFMGVGAYTTALLTIPETIKATQLPALPHALATAEQSYVPAIIVSALLAAVLAAILGGGIIRMTESTMAMATLALLVVAHTLFLNWDGVTRGSLGLFGIPVRSTIVISTVAAIVFVFLARLYKESGPGLRLRAAREDPLSSASGGIHVVRTRYAAWILSAAMTGAVGSIWAQSVIAFDANQFYFALTFSTLAMLVIGGRASVTGAIAGAAIVTFLSDTLSRVEQGVQIGPWQLPRITGTVQFVTALLIIFMLIWRPEGLFDRWEVDDLLRRLSPARRRARNVVPMATRPAELEADADTAAKEPATIGTPGSVLRGIHVAKSFEGIAALVDVDIAVDAGEIVGLIGPNGSGKTTLLNVVSGVYAPTGGEIIFHDQRIGGRKAHAIADLGLARTFQNIRLFSQLTVRENVEATSPPGTDEASVDDVLGWFGLGDVQREKATNLAYGMQRRLEIARAVIRRPTLVLLDEPAAGMNESESDELLENIRRIRSTLSCSVVVVDHDLRLIMKLCDRIQVLDQGQTIAVGLPTAVAEDPAVIQAYLGGSSARSA